MAESESNVRVIFEWLPHEVSRELTHRATLIADLLAEAVQTEIRGTVNGIDGKIRAQPLWSQAVDEYQSLSSNELFREARFAVHNAIHEKMKSGAIDLSKWSPLSGQVSFDNVYDGDKAMPKALSMLDLHGMILISPDKVYPPAGTQPTKEHFLRELFPEALFQESSERANKTDSVTETEVELLMTALHAETAVAKADKRINILECHAATRAWENLADHHEDTFEVLGEMDAAHYLNIIEKKIKTKLQSGEIHAEDWMECRKDSQDRLDLPGLVDIVEIMDTTSADRLGIPVKEIRQKTGTRIGR